VRFIFYALLLGNLAYFAWARWVDTPRPPPVNDVVARLPALKLVEGAAQPAPGQESPGALTKLALNPTAACLSVGPFPDLDTSGRAAGLLRGKGFDPHQRTEQVERTDGYWVYVGGLKTQADADRALATLRKSGIKDAVAMPEAPNTGRRLSLGLYKERPRAEHRVQVVHEAGLKAEVAERKVTGTAYWVDLIAPPGVNAVPLDDLAAEGAKSKIGVQPCAAGAATPPASAPETTAPGPRSPATGTATTKPGPATPETVTASNPRPAVPRVGPP